MSPDALLQLSIFTIAAVLLSLGCAIAVRRVHRDVVTARLEKRTAALRPRLLRLLSDDDPDLTELDTIGGTNGRLLETIVWSLLPKVRGASRSALVEWLDRRGAIERARRRTHRLGGVGRAKAAEHLGSAGVASTSPDVSRLLNDRNVEVRIVAARALGKLGDARAVPDLLDALDGAKSVPLGLIAMSIIHIGPGAVDELTIGLGRRSANARTVCAELLGLHGAIQASRYLALLLQNDPSDEVRLRAASSLGRLGAPQGVEPLVRALGSDSPVALRQVAARALGQIGGRDATGALQTALYDDEGRVAAAAGEALSLMGPAGGDVLAVVAEGDTDAARRAEDWLERTLLSNGDRRRGRGAGLAGGHYR